MVRGQLISKLIQLRQLVIIIPIDQWKSCLGLFVLQGYLFLLLLLFQDLSIVINDLLLQFSNLLLDLKFLSILFLSLDL